MSIPYRFILNENTFNYMSDDKRSKFDLELVIVILKILLLIVFVTIGKYELLQVISI